jgi:hypothetical protein
MPRVDGADYTADNGIVMQKILTEAFTGTMSGHR